MSAGQILSVTFQGPQGGRLQPQPGATFGLLVGFPFLSVPPPHPPSPTYTTIIMQNQANTSVCKYILQGLLYIHFLCFVRLSKTVKLSNSLSSLLRLSVLFWVFFASIKMTMEEKHQNEALGPSAPYWSNITSPEKASFPTTREARKLITSKRRQKKCSFEKTKLMMVPNEPPRAKNDKSSPIHYTKHLRNPFRKAPRG